MNKPQSAHSTPIREDGVWGSSKNNEYDYVLRYIAEAIDYRTKKVEMTTRAIDAYKGIPSKNGYKRGIEAYAGLFEKEDTTRADSIRTRCKSIPSKRSTIVMRAIDSMVAQAQGGVGQFECAPYDKTFEKTPELVDALDAAAMDFYEKNKIDSKISTMIEWAGLSGACYSYLGYDLDRSIDNGRIDMQIIPDTEMLIDPVSSKRNNPRYIGHQTKMSWTDLKDHIIKTDVPGEYMLESLNNVDTYLREVEYWVSKYNGNFTSLSTSIAQDGTHYAGTVYGPWCRENLPHHIDTFYKGSALAWKNRNTKYSRNFGNFVDGADDDKYHADEVEVSYLYDLRNHIQFTVVNRKFIIEAKRNYLQRTIDYSYFELDEFSGQALDMTGKKKISIDHPYVELAYKKSLWEAYSYSPLIHILDLFDDVCALETMIAHTIQIMTPITFTGNPKDIEKLGAIAGVSGEAIKGFIANSVTVLNKAVDLSPALSLLSRLESQIMQIMHGLDIQQQGSILGDRATAAEAMQGASVVSQGLNSILANIESWASELAKKMFKLTVIYEDDDFMYDLNIAGKHITLTRQDLTGDFGIKAVLKSKIKAERHIQANNTIQWFVPLMSTDAIVNKEAYAQSIIPTLAEGFTRKTIASWFVPTEEQKQAQEAQNELMRQQAKALEAQAKKDKGIDFSAIDPSSGGKYGMADIASSLGAGTALDQNGNPYFPEQGQQTSRQLAYGEGQELPSNRTGEGNTPSNYPQQDSGDLVMIDPGYSTDKPEEEEASDATINAILGAESGGQYYNDGLTGNNSAYNTSNNGMSAYNNALMKNMIG